MERSIKHNFRDYLIGRVICSCPGRNSATEKVIYILIDTPSFTISRTAVVIIVKSEGGFIFALLDIGFLRT